MAKAVDTYGELKHSSGRKWSGRLIASASARVRQPHTTRTGCYTSETDLEGDKRRGPISALKNAPAIGPDRRQAAYGDVEGAVQTHEYGEKDTIHRLVFVTINRAFF